MTPWKHAESSVKKWGGIPQDYIDIHNWFDETKQYTGDWTHRALRHHSAGIEWAIKEFGHTIRMEFDGMKLREVPTKLIAEQHVTEDCGYIPTPQDWLQILTKHPDDWMLKVGKKITERMQVK